MCSKSNKGVEMKEPLKEDYLMQYSLFYMVLIKAYEETSKFGVSGHTLAFYIG